MAIYLIRHGKDEDGFRGGWSERGLVEVGHQQSKRLGNYLKKHQSDIKIDRIISSDLTRALETAQQISKALQLPIVTSKDWRETNNGILAGMPNDEADKQFPGLYFNSLKMDERYPGGESPKENFNRIKVAFDALCKELWNADITENVLVVTHGGVINIIYHLLKGREWTNKNTFFPVAHTSFHKIELINTQWKITEENNVKHLEG